MPERPLASARLLLGALAPARPCSGNERLKQARLRLAPNNDIIDFAAEAAFVSPGAKKKLHVYFVRTIVGRVCLNASATAAATLHATSREPQKLQRDCASV